MDLKDRWKDLFESLKSCWISSKCQYIWPFIESKYSEKHRYYHTLNHIDDCFKQLDAFENDVDLGVKLTPNERFTIELAIWFHDIEYDTHASNNEARSASSLEDICSLLNISNIFSSHEIVYNAKSFILKTISHDRACTNSSLCNLFLDIDLSILGQNEDLYNQYSNDIRKEYDWVPLEMYKTKRVEILSNIINSAGIDKRIFQTEFFHHKYENKQEKIF